MAEHAVRQKQPLAEVFGYRPGANSVEAKKARNQCLCPFHNGGPRCTKDKSNDPLGVCTLAHQDTTPIICPVRFREGWRICRDAAEFLFAPKTMWTPIKEVRIPDATGKSAGNVDIVMVAHNAEGKILDFGAIELQAVYISGNLRNPFKFYINDPANNADMDWSHKPLYPIPDYLSSSRKRLIPQLSFKGKFFRAWGKRIVVGIDLPFFRTLPEIERTTSKSATLCWLVYTLENTRDKERLKLELHETVLSDYDRTIESMNEPEIGKLSDFEDLLSSKLAGMLSKLNRDYGVSSFSELIAKYPESSWPSLDSLQLESTAIELTWPDEIGPV